MRLLRQVPQTSVLCFVLRACFLVCACVSTKFWYYCRVFVLFLVSCLSLKLKIWFLVCFLVLLATPGIILSDVFILSAQGPLLHLQFFSLISLVCHYPFFVSLSVLGWQRRFVLFLVAVFVYCFPFCFMCLSMFESKWDRAAYAYRDIFFSFSF